MYKLYRKFDEFFNTIYPLSQVACVILAIFYLMMWAVTTITPIMLKYAPPPHYEDGLTSVPPAE